MLIAIKLYPHFAAGTLLSLIMLSHFEVVFFFIIVLEMTGCTMIVLPEANDLNPLT